MKTLHYNIGKTITLKGWKTELGIGL